MKPHLERRRIDRDPADTLSPECLALLVSCGNEIRATDDVPVPLVANLTRRARRRDDRDDSGNEFASDTTIPSAEATADRPGGV